MDFHSLTRKELQTLCKKNKIPANITNLAMADSLAALHQVEGLEEFLNQSQLTQSDPQQFSKENTIIGSPNVPRTACRTSTRRNKPAATEELESSQQPLARTRRVMAAAATEQERGEVIPPETPLVQSSHRRRAMPVSVSKKSEIGSVQRGYSTRRSVRILEKTLENLSLDEDVKVQSMNMKIEEVSEATMVDCSEKSDGSSEKEVSSEMAQIESKDRTEEVEDSQLSSESADSIETSDEKMGVEDETSVEKEIESVPLAKLSDEIQNLNSKDFEARRDLGTEDSLAGETPDEVSSGVIDQDIASQTCSERQEEKEEPIETIPQNLSSANLVEPTAELESENSMNLASEESSKPETLTMRSPAEISINLTSNDNAGSEEESLSKANSSEEESSESDNAVSEEESLSKANSSEEEASESDNAGSEDESLSNANSSEEESSESEASSDVESEESDSEASLVDVNANKLDSKETVLEETSLVVQAEEINSPNRSISGSKPDAKIELASPPFAADQLAGQFPRPTVSTPSKSSSKKNCALIQMITDVVDENEEDIGGSEFDNEAQKEENRCDDKNTNLATKLHEGMSLKQLRKMLKSKLQIENDKKVEKTRIALQTLPENRLAVDEPLN